jgi:hypothetical protein
LNPIVKLAKTARAFNRIAQVVLRAFPVFAPVLITLSAVEKSAVTLINNIQKALLIGLRTTSLIGLLEGRKKLGATLQSYQRKTTSFLLISNQLVWINPRRELAVEATQPKAELTTYRLRPNFQEIQTLSIQWRYKLSTKAALLPFYRWQQVFTGNCSTTIEKEKPWKPILYGDKFS